LELRAATLAEALARGLNPQDNHDELMEFVELRWLLWDVEADHAIEASHLATLVGDVSYILENLGMPPISGIPRDPCTANDILGVVGCDPGAREGGL
jgi:hypothetical protein